MADRTPAVSVLMAVKDALPHLGETLASLRALIPPPGGLEFVIVEDGSTDGSAGLLADWAAQDDRVRILAMPGGGGGLARALNHGMDAARAPLIARADADDLYAPDRLVRQVARMQADPELGALSCGYTRIDAEGREIDVKHPVTGPEILRFRMLFMNTLLHPGVMFRADPVRDLGGYDAAFWTAQDSDLWARLSAVARLDNLPDILVSYRVHPHSIMRRRGEEGRQLSLKVPARMQAAYLGGLPDTHDVAATVRLFQGFEPMDAEEIASGLAGLHRIRNAALDRETPPVIRDFTAYATASMLRHARWVKGRHPRLALRLASCALRWRLAPGSGGRRI